MHRYNMFNQIHKGLKALLYELALDLQHTDFWNVEEAEPIISRAEEVILLFEKHAASEDHFVFPAIEKYEPSVADHFEQEHVKDLQLGEVLAQSLHAYRNAPVITEKAEAGRQIQFAFINFMAFNLDHMCKEETLLNEILWRYYTDAELIGITKQIVANVPPAALARMSVFMLKGLNNAEIAAWLKDVEANAPQAMFDVLFATAQRELSPSRFRLVLEALSNGVMVA